MAVFTPCVLPAFLSYSIDLSPCTLTNSPSMFFIAQAEFPTLSIEPSFTLPKNQSPITAYFTTPSPFSLSQKPTLITISHTIADPPNYFKFTHPQISIEASPRSFQTIPQPLTAINQPTSYFFAFHEPVALHRSSTYDPEFTSLQPLH